ncbi:MAG: [FeFe] hydrogenase H-cluster radical SAM maturase HydE [Limnochordia bacterium]|jgi:biotin synthase|nr:[FeFe] hydrogenase H-cluster radical SAM maturase HydE [Limnochordia bacterium]MDD2628580.1 [FeFe] hydrogenase H-cluster radical SAM maturase HydE [Limnochordia bacterium]MDD4517210.1 [FeFe] hydrogenase H-cluster radical SAM maturase HydE [Limnochordia bacterium]
MVQTLIGLLHAKGTAQEQLWDRADGVRRDTVGNGVHLRGIIEFSNHCIRNCLYCGLRRGNTKLKRYRIPPEEILLAAKQGTEVGYKTIVLQSGEDPWYDARNIGLLVREIKKLDVAVTLSIGERPEEELALFRQEGADRYLLKHETIDQALYSRLHPGASYKARIQMLNTLGKLGYQVGTGIMVGLPGQRPETIAEDILFMQKINADMVGIGVFIPHPDTPLANAAAGSADETLNVLALTRLFLPYAHLPATTALATLDPYGRQKALRAGANVVMPNITPVKYRKQYEIYPGKAETSDESCTLFRGRIEQMILGLGRTVALDQGHSCCYNKV